MSKSLFELVWVVSLCFSTAGGQQPPTQPQTPAPVQLPPWVLHAKLTNEVMPKYPRDARERHTQGDVLIDVIVDESGNVQTAKLSNCANCSSILGDASLSAVRKWRYQPTVVDGKPAAVSSWIAFRFRLLIKPSVEILTRSESSTPSPETLKPAGSRKLRISSGVAEANLIYKVEPQYPAKAKAEHIQGDVVMQCVIDKEGRLVVTRLLSGHPVLAEPSLEVVRQWRYKPYTLNGEPVEVETTITIKFHM